MKLLAVVVSLLIAAPALAASGKRPAPAGASRDAPAEFTQFTTDELVRGFMALAFGSDLRIGGRAKGLRKFDRPVRLRIVGGGRVDRANAYKTILSDFTWKIPNLQIEIAKPGTDTEPDITIRLIDQRDFGRAMADAFGREVARQFVKRTDPECMTSVRSVEGRITEVQSFIIVDQGEVIFRDCAYHETLHAFGLSGHDDRNAFTTLNQTRTVGYLSVYDRLLLSALYDPRLRPGMDAGAVRAVLPAIFADLSR